MGSTASYWVGFNKALALTDDKFRKMSEEIKDLVYRLDTTTKQRNALIIALNYVNDTMVVMKWGGNARPEDMENVVKNALKIAAEQSNGTIKTEVKEK